jgi:hypothetical protein
VRREIPWERGALARCAGVELAANPYTAHTIAAKSWERGWEHEEARLTREAAAPAPVLEEAGAMSTSDGLGACPGHPDVEEPDGPTGVSTYCDGSCQT